jgi:murein DD-endopeptidase MepM/ murein hydrolase activator NlpD
MLITIALLLPHQAHASVFSAFLEKAKVVFLGQDEELAIESSATSQTMPVFKPVVIEDDASFDTFDTASSGALSATTGSLRVSTEDVDYPANDLVSVYEVRKGDTISVVAKLYGVSKNTIMWANDLKSEKLTPGDILVILPITGVRHTVKSGDNLSSIARKYKGDVEDIAKYNGIAPDSKLAAGDVVIVPEGEITVTATTKSGKTIVKTKVTSSYSNSTPSGFFVRPLSGGRKTQGIHGNNAVDIAANTGTPVFAASAGQVLIAKSYGYNGGYGEMIIIAHEGKVQTVYAHLSDVYVSQGQTVSQGQNIGAVGNTGRSTGPHLHFEVRGAKNPF